MPATQKKPVFDFNDLTPSGKVAKTISKAFARLGSNVVVEADGKERRTAGITYKELSLTFADSQQVVLGFKQTGDIFQVKLNGKVLPLRQQDDPAQAVAEIDALMGRGRDAFQKKLAKAKVEMPPTIQTTAARQETQLADKRDALKAAIAAVEEEIAALAPEKGVEA